LRLVAGLFAAATLAMPYAAAGQSEASWLGLVEGAAAVERAGIPERAVAERTLVAGDRLTTARGAHVEAVLADGTSVLIAGDSEVAFAELADAAASETTRNLLLLDRGELLLTSEGAAETRVDTDNATVYVGAGSCRIERSEGTTLVVAREGDVELRTRQGAVWLEAGRQAWIEGDEIAVVEPAGDSDALEQWVAALRGRQELLAFGDDGGGDLAFYDFPLDFWEIGEPVCVDHRPPGRAVRTRPPHGETGPGSTGANDPGRTAVSNDGDGARGVGAARAATADIELPVGKPWPLDDASTSEVGELPIAKPILVTNDEDSWRATSVAGRYASAEASRAKEPQPSAAEKPQTSSSSDDSATTFVAETPPASQEPVADTTPAPAPDGGGSEPAAFEAPGHDEPATEPNR
jgi:hypothetical protein